MPELPEVETFRKQVERALKGKRLKSVAPDLSDLIVFDQASPLEVRAALEGARVIGSGRKGKYFWLRLDRRPWPVFHLGMSGNVEVRKPKKGSQALGLWQGNPMRTGRARARELGDVPWFCRILLEAEDGTQVAITDPRRFGRIRLAESPLHEPPISKLGFDPLEEFPTALELVELLKLRKGPIKTVLLDQSLFAGVGNWIADEVLFQARISPHRPALSLKRTDVACLRRKLLSIVRKAVEVQVDYTRFPKTWIFHLRWQRWEQKDEVQKRQRWVIEHDQVGGRTTAWVPQLQV